MQKLIVVSILVANVVLPIWASSERNAHRGLKKTLFAMLLFDFAYLFAMLFLYPRL
jgi:hypothetical protein